MPNKRRNPSAKSSSTSETNTKQIKVSDDKKLDELIEKVEKLYGMKMPNDFKHFWKLCSEIEPNNPLDALSCLDLKLVGPFYYLSNKAEKVQQSPVFYHLRWRYYYDTPELLTVITTTNPEKNSFHIGYFRDNPNTIDDCVVVSNSGLNSQLSIAGDNLFAALKNRLCDVRNNTSRKALDRVSLLKQKLEKHAEMGDFSLTIESEAVNRRRKKVVATTFHKIGMVVPIVDEVGYRPLPHHDTKLQILFSNVEKVKNDDERMEAFEPLQEIVTFIQFANDECDYGMGLEFGISLFCHGSKYFYKMSEMLLTMAYDLLKMNLYSDICRAHFADRRTDNFSREDLCK